MGVSPECFFFFSSFAGWLLKRFLFSIQQNDDPQWRASILQGVETTNQFISCGSLLKLKHSLHDLGCAGDQPDLREAAGELAERTMEHIGGRVTEMMVSNGWLSPNALDSDLGWWTAIFSLESHWAVLCSGQNRVESVKNVQNLDDEWGWRITHK